MVRIRLRRMGGKKQPSYRLVVTDIRNARNGAFLEIIGNYDPRTNPETVVIQEEKALDWLKKGAQPTATVARLLKKTGVMAKFKPVEEKA
ncbi:MAG: 30S ribosomal protein S16 [Dehalococcoidales bacterium]|nr:30S ribosomal protein S16 [Dehalococcoidales bacterium]